MSIVTNQNDLVELLGPMLVTYRDWGILKKTPLMMTPIKPVARGPHPSVIGITTPQQMSRVFKWQLWGGLLALALSAAPIKPINAAEKVNATYSGINFELDVSDIEDYAQSGAESKLAKEYLPFLPSEDLERFSQMLQASIPVSKKVLSRFLATPSGDKLLMEMTSIIRATSPSVDSAVALRNAMELATSDEQGLTVLGVIRHYPDLGIEVNGVEGLKVLGAAQRVMQENQAAIETLKTESLKRSQESTVTPHKDLRQLEQHGAFEGTKQTLTLQDSTPKRLKYSGKTRQFSVDLYQPMQAESQPRPVIIISHGLGAGRSAYAYLAEYFVSHGYVVAVPEHPGSSFQQWQSLFQGDTHEISNPNEFIDRSLDIQFLLDELTHLEASEAQYQGKLNLENVGIIGHSFGGYTALSLAGGNVDADHLVQTCQQSILESLNPSLLLQCQALKLPTELPDLKDERIKSVVLSQPLISALISPEGLKSIDIPLMMFAGGQDNIALPIAEQIRPFSQLSSPQKYFVLMDKSSHTSTSGESSPEERVFDESDVEADPSEIPTKRVLKVLGLRFFDTTLNNSQTDFNPQFYSLSAALNHPGFPLFPYQ